MRYIVVLLAFVSGCAAAEAPADVARPVLDTPAEFALRVGDPVELPGSDFLRGGEGWVAVRFEGLFSPDDGGPDDEVDFTVRLSTRVDGVVTWRRFGGYRVPFGRGDQLGVFEGTVTATNEYFAEPPEGSPVAPSEPRPITIRVRPSVVLLDAFPFAGDDRASCAEPATTHLPGLDYALRFKSLGLSPESWEVTTSEGLVRERGEVAVDPTKREVPLAEPELGVVVRWAEAPTTGAYATSVAAVARVAGGEEVATFVPLLVQAPARFLVPEQTSEIDTVLQAERISDCIAGGPSSTETEFPREVVPDVRSRELMPAERWEPAGVEQAAPAWPSAEDVPTIDLRAASPELAMSARFAPPDSPTTLEVDVRGAEVSARFGELSMPVAPLDVPRAVMSVEARTCVPNYSPPPPCPDDACIVQRDRVAGHDYDLPRTYEHVIGAIEERRIAVHLSYDQELHRRGSIEETFGPLPASGADADRSDYVRMSSENSNALQTRGYVWADRYGVWYRQAYGLRRPLLVVTTDACGNSTRTERRDLREWAWASDLAIGRECAPLDGLPPSNLPPCNNCE